MLVTIKVLNCYLGYCKQTIESLETRNWFGGCDSNYYDMLKYNQNTLSWLSYIYTQEDPNWCLGW